MNKKLKGKYKERKNLEWSTPGLHKRILELISAKKGTALDLACGSGNLINGLIQKGYEVIGVDIENFLFDKKIKFKKADLNKRFPFKNNSFTLVTATEIIEHLENPRHFFKELKRILKKDGLAIVSTPNLLNWKARTYYPLRGIIWGFRKKDYEISGHITPVTKYDFKRICDEEKLKIERITYNNSNKEFFGDNLIIIIKKL